jgi:hypothetical protein
MKIRCAITDKEHSWEEELTVESKKTAKEDIQKILDNFNSDLRPGEKTRYLVEILAEKKIEEKTIGEVFKDIELVLMDLRREINNAYGNVWLKTNNDYQFRLLIKAYDKMLEKGESKSFKNKLVEVFVNVQDIRNGQDLKYLCKYDFDTKLKVSPITKERSSDEHKTVNKQDNEI